MIIPTIQTIPPNIVTIFSFIVRFVGDLVAISVDKVGGNEGLC